MQPVTFYIKNSVVRKLRVYILVLGALFIGFAAYDFANLLLRADYGPVGEFLLPPGYESWWHAVPAVILTVSAVACVTVALRVFRHGSADHNFLLLDDDGVTHMSWGHRRQWSWRELPSFQMTKSGIFGHKFIKLALPGAMDWRTRFGLRPGVRRSSGKRVVLIANVYGAPLDEIAARLNECRDAALSAGSGSSELAQ